MEFVALLIWLLLFAAGMVLLPLAITAPGAGIAALAAFGGTGMCILWIALGAPAWTGWAQLGLAVVGIVGAGVAAAQLVDERWISGSVLVEWGAASVGLQLPFYGALICVTLLMAVQVTDPVV
jgi:hypothetical protein